MTKHWGVWVRSVRLAHSVIPRKVLTESQRLYSCEGLIKSPWLALAYSIGHFYWEYILVSIAISLTHPTWLIHHLVRIESIQVYCFEWLHLEALGDCVSLWISLVTLGGCHHLDGLVQWGSSSRGRCLSLALIVVIVRGSWPFLGGELKDTLVDCSWLVWSSSCVGCATLDYGLGMWCLLAREPPSEWIAITGTSLPTSKWILVKNHCVISCHRDSIVIDWLHLVIGSFLDTAL
jgi:hypothetical protein